jgi:Tol biopolymer transport system component
LPAPRVTRSDPCLRDLSGGEITRREGTSMRGKSIWEFAVAALVLGGGLQHVALHGRGAPGSVAFFSARSGNNEIYVMDQDGGRPLRITESPSSDVDPDISTNGRDIVFTSNRTGNNDIYIVDSTGRNPVNLTENAANDGWARWAPDGHHIVFHSNRAGNFELYAMNSDGSDLRRLTDYSGVDQYPEWSPDGREIAFRRDTDIYVLEVASGETRRLTNAPPLNQMPSWSPNGKQLAFMSSRAGYISVFVMNADGSDQRNLTPKDAGIWTATGSAGRLPGRRTDVTFTSCLRDPAPASIRRSSS